MRVLLTGGSGQLGKTIISAKPKEINLFAPNSSQLNLKNHENIKEVINSEKPDWIINCGAYTNVDQAESEIELVETINSYAPKTLACEILKYGGKLLQISSDYVFEGSSKKPYRTDAKKTPQNVYGKSKLLAEESIEEILKDSNQYLILRTSWVMSPYGKNFVKTILNLLQKEKTINVVDDQIGSMTSTKYLANICWQLIDAKESLSKKDQVFPPIHHWSDEGIVSWYEIAIAIRDISKDLGMIKSLQK